MTGRVIVVTGANGGLGYEVSRYLCEGGNDVILACRNEEKANRAIEKIKRQNPNALATFMQLDLGSLESIHKFVEAFHESEKKLHVLVNNAGVMQNGKDVKRQYTKDNFEIAMGTNHLGPFLLTNLMLDDLKKSASDEGAAPSRIVNISATAHDPDAGKKRSNIQPIDFDNFFLFNEHSFNGMQAYKNSKAAVVMFTAELARRLEGTNVTVNCLCPGFIPSTDLMRSSSGAQKFFNRYIMHGMLRFTKVTRTVQQGANAIVALATDEKFKEMNGKFFKEGAETKISEEAADEEKQKKMWELSGGYTRMEGYEAIEVPPPPVEEKKEEKEEEKKEEGEEAAADGEAKAEEGEEKKEGDEEEKKEEEKEEKKEEEKEEKKEEEEVKKEEVKEDVKTEESKPEETKAEEEKTEEKKE